MSQNPEVRVTKALVLVLKRIGISKCCAKVTSITQGILKGVKQQEWAKKWMCWWGRMGERSQCLS